MDVPYDVKEGDPYPGADWYNGVLACLRRLRLVVARDSGLSKVEGPYGTTLSVTFPPRPKFAVTTSSIGVRTGTSPNFTFGSGTAKLLDLTANAGTNVATSTGRTDSIRIYHGGQTTPVASGHLVQLKWIDDLPFVDVDYC
jgi:hypothetical protein